MSAPCNAGGPSARAILWGVVRDDLIAGALIAIPIAALMWGTAAL